MWKRKPKEWHPDDILPGMLARNQLIWDQLKALGVTEETPLRLEFFYDSAGGENDQQLAEHLRSTTDYDVKVGHSESYGVTGWTQPGKGSPEALNAWVAAMVHAGYENGRCTFDGWGAPVPEGVEPPQG